MSKKLFVKIKYDEETTSAKDILKSIDDVLPEDAIISSMDKIIVAEIIQLRIDSEGKKWLRGYLEALRDLSIISEKEYEDYLE